MVCLYGSRASRLVILQTGLIKDSVCHLDFIDAKPLWAALYHSANPINTEDYEHRRSSMHQILSRCDGLIIRGKRLILGDLVARGGVEPPRPAFSVRSSGLTSFSINNLTRQSGRFIVTIL